MIARWLMGLERVHEARTRAEREAIFAFRYRIYVEELKKGFLEVDHARRWIHDPEDDLSGTTLFYTGTPEEVTGTLRLETWDPGEVPAEVARRFSLHLFPGIEGHRVAETSRLLISPSFRGNLILPAIARAGYERLCEQGVYFVFCYCAPGLVRAYRTLGYRPFRGDLVCNADGVRVPLVGIMSDLEYAEGVRSPVAPLIRQFFGYGPGQHPPLDLAPYRAILDPGPLPFEVEPDEVWRHLQDEILEQDDVARASLFLETLPARSVRKLAEKGFIMDVPAGRNVVRADLVEREMFFILDGRFEVVSGDRRIALLDKGEVFGEVALLAEPGRRTATIRSLTPGRVLVLRRRFLAELMQDDPSLATQLLFNMSRILAHRLSSMLQEPGDGAAREAPVNAA